VYATITRTFEKGKLISEKLNTDWNEELDFDYDVDRFAEHLNTTGRQIIDIRRSITYCNADIERNYNRYETHESGTYESDKFLYLIEFVEFVYEN
jgi:hypothetical protein